MGDAFGKDSADQIQIVGSDNNYAADVVREDNVNKLLVKATTVPDVTSRLVFEKFLNGGSADMAINGGAGTTFSVVADPTLDKIVREIKFSAFDGGIKVDTFLGQNSELTNGIIVRINTSGVAQDFIPIKTTQDFDGHFAYGDGGKFNLITASGSDSVVAQFSPREPIVLKAGSADTIEIIIQDNLSNVDFLEAIAFGLYDI